MTEQVIEDLVQPDSSWEELELLFTVNSSENLKHTIPVTVAYPPSDNGYVMALQALLGVNPDVVQHLYAQRFLDGQDEGDEVVEAEVVEDGNIISTEEPTA